MNREEILEKSKKENQGADIFELEVSKAGNRIGWIVIIALLMLVSIVDIFVYGSYNSEVLFAATAASASISGYKYIKIHKSFYLVLTIISGLASVLSLISWVVDMMR